MKKLVLTIAAIAALTSMHAQDENTTSEGFKKGDAFITGDLGIYSQKQNDIKTNLYSAGASFGHFVSEHLALGVRLGYAAQKTNETDDTPEYKQNSFSGGLFGRYYFTPQNKFSFYGQLGADYNHYKRELSSGSDETANGFGIYAGPGINYFITPHLALHSFLGALQYGSSTSKNVGGDVDNNSFSLNLDLSAVNFGLTYKF